MSMLYDANQRIEKIRKKDVEFIVRKDGRPVSNAQINVKMKKHQFLFGSNCFPANSYEEAAGSRYKKYFSDLFNYTTLPFFWQRYERERGKTDHERLEKLLQWCEVLDLKTKGHPIVWQKLAPEWLENSEDVETSLKKRIEHLMENFGDRIDYWDVFNEITVDHLYHNAVSRWIHEKGRANAVRYTTKLVREINPHANLLYNDFNIWNQECEVLLEELRYMGVELQAVGIQSHMHTFLWTMEEAWEVCERFAKYGWPLHFTELTVLSGRYIGRNGMMNDDSKPEDWYRGKEYEELQAKYTADFYTMLFSHPAVEAITWWDFQDNDWRAAPAGLVTEEVHRKPAYHALRKLIRENWWSDEFGKTNGEGIYRCNVYHGDYQIEMIADGKKAVLEIPILREAGGPGKPQKIEINL